MSALFRLLCMVAALVLPGTLATAADIAAPVAAAKSGLPAGGLVLRGTLGAAQVQMQLRAKPDEDEGIEGEYFVFGHGKQILLAGEMDEQAFWMEESVNGTDVSGQWEGRREGDFLTGEWRAAEGGDPRKFSLRVLRPGAARPAR